VDELITVFHSLNECHNKKYTGLIKLIYVFFSSECHYREGLLRADLQYQQIICRIPDPPDVYFSVFIGGKCRALCFKELQ